MIPTAKTNCSALLFANPSLRLTKAKTQHGAFPMAVRHPDWASHKIRQAGFWEITSPDELTMLAYAGSMSDKKDSGSFRPRPSDVDGARGLFVDIGAHVGFYSFLFASLNYTVLTLEPMPTNRDAIAATMCMNPRLAERITLVPTAIGLDNRQCMLRSLDRGDGNGELDCTAGAQCKDTRPGKPCTNRRLPCQCHVVEAAPLDSVLRRHLPARRRSFQTVVAKIDVEGSECAVLSSGQTLFTHYRADYVQLELLRPETQRCAHEEAERHGYAIGPHRGHDNNSESGGPNAGRGAGVGCRLQSARTTGAHFPLTLLALAAVLWRQQT